LEGCRELERLLAVVAPDFGGLGGDGEGFGVPSHRAEPVRVVVQRAGERVHAGLVAGLSYAPLGGIYRLFVPAELGEGHDVPVPRCVGRVLRLLVGAGGTALPLLVRDEHCLFISIEPEQCLPQRAEQPGHLAVLGERPADVELLVVREAGQVVPAELAEILGHGGEDVGVPGRIVAVVAQGRDFLHVAVDVPDDLVRAEQRVLPHFPATHHLRIEPQDIHVAHARVDSTWTCVIGMRLLVTSRARWLSSVACGA
jgi:hypothetical protein